MIINKVTKSIPEDQAWIGPIFERARAKSDVCPRPTRLSRSVHLTCPIHPKISDPNRFGSPDYDPCSMKIILISKIKREIMLHLTAIGPNSSQIRVKLGL